MELKEVIEEREKKLRDMGEEMRVMKEYVEEVRAGVGILEKKGEMREAVNS